MILPEELVGAAARTSLYRSLREGCQGAFPRDLSAWPATGLRHLLRAQTEQGDPFGGRLDPSRRPCVVFQAGDGLPLYWALEPGDMAGVAAALAQSWRHIGIGPGDRVAIYDYGTSPLTLFASRNYVPFLRAGAADLIGCVPICNDGLPELAPRAIHILRYLRPRVLFASSEAMEALVLQAKKEQISLRGLTAAVIVSADEQVLAASQREGWAQALGVPVRQMLRADAALFLAGPCPDSDVYHVSSKSYWVEVLPEDGGGPLPEGQVGPLVITNLALSTCPVIRYVSEIRGAVSRRRCTCGARGLTILPVE